jgi:hypothetical protein
MSETGWTFDPTANQSYPYNSAERSYIYQGVGSNYFGPSNDLPTEEESRGKSTRGNQGKKRREDGWRNQPKRGRKRELGVKQEKELKQSNEPGGKMERYSPSDALDQPLLSQSRKRKKNDGGDNREDSDNNNHDDGDIEDDATEEASATEAPEAQEPLLSSIFKAKMIPKERLSPLPRLSALTSPLLAIPLSAGKTSSRASKRQ